MIDPIVLVVTISGLVSAFNPYSIGILTLLISVVYGGGRTTRHALALGVGYVLSLFAASVLAGVGLLYLYSLLPLIAASYLLLGIAILVVCAGLLEIKDYFWYGQGPSLTAPKLTSDQIRNLTKGYPGLLSAVMLGILAAVLVAPSSHAAYLALLVVLRDFSVSSVSLIVLYSAVLTLPLIAVLIAVLSGIRVSSLQRWKEDNKATMRLATGLLMVALGWILILISNGVIGI